MWSTCPCRPVSPSLPSVSVWKGDGGSSLSWCDGGEPEPFSAAAKETWHCGGGTVQVPGPTRYLHEFSWMGVFLLYWKWAFNPVDSSSWHLEPCFILFHQTQMDSAFQLILCQHFQSKSISVSYSFMFPPHLPPFSAPEALMQALEDLDYLAALNHNGNLSDVGIIMSELPLEPPLAKALIASFEYDCVDELLTIAAMLTGSSFFFFKLPLH